jgi:TfoX/Sxy family transcriptional regulator of competence genes
MSTSKEYATYIEDQLQHIQGIYLKKMFGEYGLFYLDKMVGLVCDDQLFIKPTKKGEEILVDPTFGVPYTGAKPYYLIDDPENREMLSELILKTYEELPLPKPKKKK